MNIFTSLFRSRDKPKTTHQVLRTGCRRGELMGLKWSDIDFNTGIITVRRSNYKISGDPEIHSKSTKLF